MKKAILALAILERGDLWFQYESEKEITKLRSDPSDRTDFGLFVRGHIERLLRALRASSGEISAADLFNSIAATVVSVPGVVRDNRALLQVPSWRCGVANAPDRSGLTARDELYDFPHSLSDCVQSIVEEDGDKWRRSERERFQDTVFVVNDATTCAVFEYEKRRREWRRDNSPDIADFVYIVANGGINVGVIGRSYDNKVVVQTNHAEAGHVFVPTHHLDDWINFKGACNFHRWCLEGMAGVSAFLKRVNAYREITDDLFWPRLGDKEGPRIRKYKKALETWAAETDRLAGQGLEGRVLEDGLLRFVLQANSPDGGVGIELVAHYMGQLTHQVIVGPLSPKQVVLDGRMINEDIIRAVRRNVVKWAHGYPRRKELGKEGIKNYVVPSSKADAAELETIGVMGALQLGYSRTKLKEHRASGSIHLFRGRDEE